MADGLVSTGRRVRRWRTASEKLAIVQLTLRPGASVAEVARAQGMNANQLFKWRRAFERGELSESNVALIPVRVNTHPATILRRLETCNPLRFAAIVPATPELSTLVVLTGSPANFPDYWFTRFRPMPTAGTTLH